MNKFSGSDLADALRRLSWRRIAFAALVLGLLTVLFVYITVYAFVVSHTAITGENPGPERLQTLVGLVGNWGARLFFFLVVLAAASWVVRCAGELAVAHGIAVGVSAALVQQGLIYLLTPSVEFWEFSAYLVLGILGGWLGAIEGRSALDDREGVYRASRDIGAARSVGEVAEAISVHLGEETVGLSIWGFVPLQNEASDAEREPEEAGEFEPLASSAPFTSAKTGRTRTTLYPPGLGPEAPGALDAGVWADLQRKSWSVVQTKDLTEAQRAELDSTGVRSMLVVSLDDREGRKIGLLVIGFADRSQPSRGTVRQYLTIASQVALFLEYLHLAEEFRRAGQQAGVMRERQRLSHEIHDTLAQGFTSVVSNLTAAETLRAVQNDSEGDPREAEHLEQARAVARESLSEARRLVWALRPESLDRHPLSEAIGRLVRSWSEDSGVPARFEVTGGRTALRPEVEVALLRSAQEALSNIRKHAEARRVRITLSYMDDIAVLDVADDGKGFDPSSLERGVGADDRGGFGLTAMRERIEHLGGVLLVESAPGRGTTLAMELPMEGDEVYEPQVRGNGNTGGDAREQNREDTHQTTNEGAS